MITEKTIFSIIILAGMVGLAAYFWGPKEILYIRSNVLKIKISITKSIGLFMILSFMPALLIFIALFIKIPDGNYLAYLAGLFLIIIFLSSLSILLSYFINDYFRELEIDLQNKIIHIKERDKSTSIAYSSKTKIVKVSGRWHSFNNPINILEHLVIDEKLVITNLSIDLEELTKLMGLKHIHENKKWFTFINRKIHSGVKTD